LHQAAHAQQRHAELILIPAVPVDDGVDLRGGRGRVRLGCGRSRQRKPCFTRDDDPVGAGLDDEIVRIGEHGEAVRRRQQAKLREALLPHDAPWRPESGCNRDPLSAAAIVDPMRPGRVGERNRQRRAARPIDAARGRQRLRRRMPLLSDGEGPALVVRR
jgi:hypothetical protein